MPYDEPAATAYNAALTTNFIVKCGDGDTATIALQINVHCPNEVDGKAGGKHDDAWDA